MIVASFVSTQYQRATEDGRTADTAVALQRLHWPRCKNEEWQKQSNSRVVSRFGDKSIKDCFHVRQSSDETCCCYTESRTVRLCQQVHYLAGVRLLSTRWAELLLYPIRVTFDPNHACLTQCYDGERSGPALNAKPKKAPLLAYTQLYAGTVIKEHR